MQGEKHETSKEQGTNAKQKNNKKQNSMQKNTKNHTLTRKKSLLGFVFLFVVSPGGGATLNLRILNPKPNSNLRIFPLRPQRTGFGFSCENSYCSSVFFF